MPMLEQRDPAETRSALNDWLRATLPADAQPELLELTAPEGSGFSSETLLATAQWHDGTGIVRHELVIRLAGRRFRMVPNVLGLAEQLRVLRVLARHSTVPVPEVLWHETDPRHLGGPFLVMRTLPGRVPGDQPPYHEAGWFADLAPAARTAMWWSGVDTLARLHEVDAARPGLEFLATREPLAALLQRLRAQQQWVAQADTPGIRAAQEWLAAHQPAAHDDPVLLWGDARLGNLLYTGTAVTGALDWEKAMAGPREIDVAWFLYVDRHHSEGVRLPRLAGLPSAADTVARYQELTGHELRDLPYHQLLSAYHFALLMIRAVALLIEFGLMPEDVGAGYVQNNSATRLLATCLSEVD